MATSLGLLTPSVGSFTAGAAVSSYICEPHTIPVRITVQITDLKLAARDSQTHETSNLTARHTRGLTASYHVFSELCVPDTFANGGLFGFAIHGYVFFLRSSCSNALSPWFSFRINFDRRYWLFGAKVPKGFRQLHQRTLSPTYVCY